RSRVCFTHLGLRRARSPLFPYTTLFRSVRGYVFDLMAIDRRSQKKGVYTPFFCTGLFHDPYERLWFFYFAGYPVDIFYGLVPMGLQKIPAGVHVADIRLLGGGHGGPYVQ